MKRPSIRFLQCAHLRFRTCNHNYPVSLSRRSTLGVLPTTSTFFACARIQGSRRASNSCTASSTPRRHVAPALHFLCSFLRPPSPCKLRACLSIPPLSDPGSQLSNFLYKRFIHDQSRSPLPSLHISCVYLRILCRAWRGWVGEEAIYVSMYLFRSRCIERSCISMFVITVS